MQMGSSLPERTWGRLGRWMTANDGRRARSAGWLLGSAVVVAVLPVQPGPESALLCALGTCLALVLSVVWRTAGDLHAALLRRGCSLALGALLGTLVSSIWRAPGCDVSAPLAFVTGAAWPALALTAALVATLARLLMWLGARSDAGRAAASQAAHNPAATSPSGNTLARVAAWLAGKRWCVAAAAAVLMLASIGTSLLRLYTSPAVYTYDPFFGLLSASFYDVGQVPGGLFWAHRALTAALAVGLLMLTRLSAAPDHPDMQGQRSRTHAAGWLLVSVGFLTLYPAAEALGFAMSTEALAAARPLKHNVGRCTVHLPGEVDSDIAEMLAFQCEAEVQAAESLLGTSYDATLDAYFFRSASEKGALIGASGTYLAKPWQRSVYLQLDALPHPVLGHEVAHVVAGELAQGPFKVAGRAGGLWPNPGLIEGVATYVAGEIDSDFDSETWARALLAEDKLPALEDLFGLAFFGGNARASYTVAAAFLGWMVAEFGVEALQRAYRTGSLTRATGQASVALENAWHTHLHALEVNSAAQERARVRFAAPSVFRATCPHHVAQLRSDLARARQLPDPSAWIRAAEALLPLAPGDLGARTALALGALAQDNIEEMEAQLGALEDTWGAASPAYLTALEHIADARFIHGDTAYACAAYARFKGAAIRQDSSRRLHLKRLVCADPSSEANRVLADLIITPSLNSYRDIPRSLLLTETLAKLRPDGLGDMLRADILARAQLPQAACAAQRSALSRGLSLSYLGTGSPNTAHSPTPHCANLSRLLPDPH